MENIISERRQQLELEELKQTKKMAFYLISLFYKSGERYFCSRPKINRLLTIYKFCSVRHDPNCFHFSFVPGGSGLMGIKGLSSFVERDVYLNFYMYDDDKQEFTDTFDETVEIPGRYVNDFLIRDYEISDKVKELLEIIFRKFGSYPISDLAQMIDQMKNNIPFRKKVDEVNFIYYSLDADEFLEFLNY